MSMELRFSTPVSVFLGGLLALAESVLVQFPDIIPIAPLRVFILGAIPLSVTFLYQEAGVTVPLPVIPATPAPTA